MIFVLIWVYYVRIKFRYIFLGVVPERILRVLYSLTMADQRNREREKGKVKERDSVIEWK